MNPHQEGVSYATYRKVRKDMLIALTYRIRSLYSGASIVLGYALEDLDGLQSEDLVLQHFDEWTEADEEHSRYAETKYKLLTKQVVSTPNDFGFPIDRLASDFARYGRPMPELVEPIKSRVHFGKVGRNQKCPCGSGKKFKHCCIGRF